MKINTVIISRTDAIGDVVLTLPLAKILKNLMGENTRIIFFGRTYTEPVISSCENVDGFINYDTFIKEDEKGRAGFLRRLNADAIVHVFPRKEISLAAKHAGIPLRIGATGRMYHWFDCNRLVWLSRKRSRLHEAQLNVKLLKPLGYSGEISKEELGRSYGLLSNNSLPQEISVLLRRDKFRIVLHPKSHASAREWSLDNFTRLIQLLPEEKFQIIITGGEKEAAAIAAWKSKLPAHVLNLAGKLSLGELISLLNDTDGIVAASTGPLHISAALGKYATGIYPPIRPMDPGRWAPLGVNSDYLVVNKTCSDCRSDPSQCHCMNEITPKQVADKLNSVFGS